MFFQRYSTLLQVLSFSLLVGTSGFAQAPDDELYYGFYSNQEHVALHLRKIKNQFGQIQINASLIEKHWLMPDTEKPFLYGIDRNDDGYPETWFHREGWAVKDVFFHHPKNASARQEYTKGEDAIFDIVQHLQVNPRWMSEVIISRASGLLMPSIASGQAAIEQFFQDELTVYQLDLAANELAPGSSEAKVLHEIADRTWDLAAKTVVDETRGPNYFQRGTVDILVFVGTMQAFKYLGKFSSWAVDRFAATEVGERVSARMANASGRLSTLISNSLNSTASGIRAQVGLAAQATLDFSWMDLPGLRGAAAHAMRFVSARKDFAGQILKTFASSTSTIYKTGFKEWDYVLQTQALQIIAEAWARKDEIYDPNPIVMSKQLFENQDFLQNLAFMTNETLLQTGVHAGQGSTSKKLLLAGFASLVDSGIMNLAIKGNVDMIRVAGDTGWEVIFGNLQSLLDNAVFRRTGRNLIETGRTPGAKLAGYAIYWVAPSVNQLAGYIGYSRATTAYEVWKKSAEENKPVPKEALPSLRLVPIEVTP